MAQVTFKGNPVNTNGELPKKGNAAPDFKLVLTDLSEKTLADYKGKRVILNIFPSLDTSVCAASVRKFNEEATNLSDTVVVNVSKDLPFAHSRFCAAEGIKNVENASSFRNNDFGDKYGVLITDSALAGLFARAIVVIDENGKVEHTELVPEIAQEPNYEAAISILAK